MLSIVVTGVELYDEAKNEFLNELNVALDLEHSLVSLSKWESFYGKPFLDKKEKSTEEVLDYIKFMTLTPDISPEVFTKLSKENTDEINNYLEAKMTATWFSDSGPPPASREVVTSELIYYWMITFEIPFECQYWHINRLFTLIRVCNLKQSKPKKMSRSEAAQRNRELNAQRKAQLGTKG